MYSVVLWSNCKKNTINVIPSTSITRNTDGTDSAQWGNKSYQVKVLRKDDDKKYLEALDFVDGTGLVSPKKFGDVRKRRQESEEAVLSMRKKTVIDKKQSEILDRLEVQEGSKNILADRPSACPQCNNSFKLTSKHVEVLQEIIEFIQKTEKVDVGFPTFTNNDAAQSKIPLLPGSTIYLNSKTLDSITKTFRKDPKEMIRRIIKAYIPFEKLERMTRTGKGDSEKMPAELLEDTKFYVNKNVPKSLRLSQKDFDYCITTMINTLKRANKRKEITTTITHTSKNFQNDSPVNERNLDSVEGAWDGYSGTCNFEEPLDFIRRIENVYESRRNEEKDESAECDFALEKSGELSNRESTKKATEGEKERELYKNLETDNNSGKRDCHRSRGTNEEDDLREEGESLRDEDYMRPKDNQRMNEKKSEKTQRSERENAVEKEDNRERIKNTEKDSSRYRTSESETDSMREKNKKEKKDYSEKKGYTRKDFNERKRDTTSAKNHCREKENAIANDSRKEENDNRRRNDSSANRALTREKDVRREKCKRREKADSEEREYVKKNDNRGERGKKNEKHHRATREKSVENDYEKEGNKKKGNLHSEEKRNARRKATTRNQDRKREKDSHEKRTATKERDTRRSQGGKREKVHSEDWEEYRKRNDYRTKHDRRNEENHRDERDIGRKRARERDGSGRRR